MTAKVLNGSKDKKIRSFRLDKITTYGILSAYTERELTEWINFLIAEQILATKEGQYPTLQLNQNSVNVLKGKQNVWMHSMKVPASEDTDFHEGLFSILRQLRKDIDRKSTRLNSCHVSISYAVFCLKKNIKTKKHGQGGFKQCARRRLLDTDAHEDVRSHDSDVAEDDRGARSSRRRREKVTYHDSTW